MIVPVASAVPAAAGPVAAAPQAAATAPAYDATIKITEHGIPHVSSDTFEGMAYGAGWATMSAATCNLMDTLLTARGLRSKYDGPDATYRDSVGGSGSNLEWDTLVTDLRDRQVVENLLADPVAGPSDRAEAMVVAETAGDQRLAERQRDHRPGVRGQGVDQARRHDDRRLVRLLPRPADLLDDPAAAGRSPARRRRRREGRDPSLQPSREELAGRTSAPDEARVRLERHRGRRQATRRQDAACCSATRTSRGWAATGSPRCT